MIGRTTELRRTLPALIASIPITIVYFAVLGIVLTAAGPDGLDLTDAQTSGWIAVLYGLPTLIALVLTVRFRQPLLITGTIFVRSSSSCPSEIGSASTKGQGSWFYPLLMLLQSLFLHPTELKH